MGSFMDSEMRRDVPWCTATDAILEMAAEWLREHPRGSIEMLPDPNGFVVSRACIDPATGNECADAATGFAPTLLAALAACMREGE